MVAVVVALIALAGTVSAAAIQARTNKKVHEVYREVKSPNGSTSGEAIHAVLVAVEAQGDLIRAHIENPAAHTRKRVKSGV